MNDLMNRIQSNLNEFSKGQRLIARYITEHYDKAAFMTASRFALRLPHRFQKPSESVAHAGNSRRVTFSTDALHAAQCIPEMSYFSSFMGPPVSWVIYPRGVYLLASIYTPPGVSVKNRFSQFSPGNKKFAKGLDFLERYDMM